MSLFKAPDTGAMLEAVFRESDAEVLVFDAHSLRILQANHALTKQDFLGLLSKLQNGKKRRGLFNAQCIRRDSTFYPIEARLFPSVSNTRKVFMWVATDLSQREATQQALSHSESDLRAIVARIPGMAYQVKRGSDHRTELRYVSEQSTQLLGINASALRAHPELFFQLILEEDKADYLHHLEMARGSHMTFNWEGRIWLEAWKDVKWVNLRVSQRKTKEGLIWDGIMLNVTHSKLAEAEILRSRAQLSTLTAHLEAIKEQERLNMAREVHDDLGGNLTAIKIGLSWLLRNLPPDDANLIKRTAYLDNVVDQTIDATHRITYSLRPPVLDFGIVVAIEWLLKNFNRSTDIPYQFVAPPETAPLHPDVAISVFRIVQEALTNISKHAQATEVSVTLERHQNDLEIVIHDNGRGLPSEFCATRIPDENQGFGLLNMTERATALGGKLAFHAATPQGTRISLRIPLPALTPDQLHNA
jgi:two-component system sensor histidine kinase UhpB